MMGDHRCGGHGGGGGGGGEGVGRRVGSFFLVLFALLGGTFGADQRALLPGKVSLPDGEPHLQAHARGVAPELGHHLCFFGGRGGGRGEGKGGDLVTGLPHHNRLRSCSRLLLIYIAGTPHTHTYGACFFF